MRKTADSDVFLHSYHLSCLITVIFIHSIIHSFIHSFIKNVHSKIINQARRTYWPWLGLVFIAFALQLIKIKRILKIATTSLVAFALLLRIYLFVCLFVFSFVDLFYTPNTIPQARLHLLFFNPTIPSLLVFTSEALTLKFVCVSISPPSRLSPCYLHHNPPVSFYSVFYHLLNLPYKLELIYVHIGTFYHLSFIFVLTIPPSQFSPCHLTTIP